MVVWVGVQVNHVTLYARLSFIETGGIVDGIAAGYGLNDKGLGVRIPVH
jgi:hypothetical protein